MKVFIADDSNLVCGKLASMVSDVEGVEVVGTAADCQRAFESILELRPDVAILDMRMPNGSGYFLLEKVKKWLPDLRVIVLTNFSEKIYRDWCLEEGADFFFDKSTEFEKIQPTLEKLRAATAS